MSCHVMSSQVKSSVVFCFLLFLFSNSQHTYLPPYDHVAALKQTSIRPSIHPSIHPSIPTITHSSMHAYPDLSPLTPPRARIYSTVPVFQSFFACSDGNALKHPVSRHSCTVYQYSSTSLAMPSQGRSRVAVFLDPKTSLPSCLVQ